MELTGRVAAERAPVAVPRRVFLVGAVGLALAGVGLIVPWVGPIRPGVGLASIAVGIAAALVMLAASLIAWQRQPDNPVWRLMVANYFATYLWEIAFIPSSVAFTIQPIVRDLGVAIFAHLALAFPSGHLRGRAERWLVAFVYLYAVGTNLLHSLLWAPTFTCDPYCPTNLLALWPNNALADQIGIATGVFVPIIGLVVAILVWRHWQVASQPTRRALLPVALAVPLTLVSASIGYPADALGVNWLSDLVRSPAWELSAFIFPVAFLVAVLQLRMARSAVAGAVVELGALPTLGRLQQVLRGRLGDHRLRVLRWSPVHAAWIDEDGHTVTPPLPDADRAFLIINRDRAPLAAVDHDAALLNDAGLASMVSSAALLALDATDVRDELRARGGNTSGLPTGEVTFVFGDIEESTPLLEQLGERYGELLTEIRRAASDIADRNGGRLVDAMGDEVFLVFPRAAGAVATALALTRRTAETHWPDGRTVRLRIGIHTGRPDLTSSGYIGIDVHRAARVMAAAHGGQVVASLSVVTAIEAGDDTSLRPLGRFALRGLSEPLALFQLEAPGLASKFPPLRAEPAS